MCLGTKQQGEEISFPIEGVDGGSISMLAVQVGNNVVCRHRQKAKAKGTAKDKGTKGGTKQGQGGRPGCVPHWTKDKGDVLQRGRPDASSWDKGQRGRPDVSLLDFVAVYTGPASSELVQTP